ncbi:FAD-dependent monooxygenase [Danxiaibacter flavus]|uniref:FAD-dependent monooxygenase n=1 Tax=Danxiaibacter flavus TaxID=3049108 RepID=A0ABV3ZDA4_9BACT|nr:FAD-dependent monooxygenase [Chitinophagaceae bacterium DXS]
MKALIIGGGIGGLTTAIALKQRGISFEVYEAAEEIKAVGAGIWLGANAMNMFEKLGVAEKIKASSVCLKKAYIKDYKGNILQTIDNEALLDKYGHTSQAIHRSTLQKILAEEMGNAIQLNKRCVSVEQNKDGVKVCFADGTTAAGDLLVGADGIRSVIREQYVTNAFYRYSGQTCWRATVNMQLPENEINEAAEVWGYSSGLRASYSQVGENQVYFWYTKAMPEGNQLSNGDALALIKKDLKHFYGNMNVVVDNIDPAMLIKSDLYDFRPIDKWFNGRIVLIGDAAHATTPNLGQGASQAIEDAWVLAGCLKVNQTITGAFEQYQHLRMKRAKKIVKTSYQIARATNFKSGFARALRNFLIKNTPASITQKQFEMLYNVNYEIG